MGTVGAIATHDAVLSAATPIAAAIALAKAGQFAEAAKKAREAAERIYEAARELWEAARITLQRIYEAVVEAVARALDYVKAHWFIFAAAAAGLIAYAAAQQLDFSLWVDHVARFAPFLSGTVKPPKAPKLSELIDKLREVKGEVIEKRSTNSRSLRGSEVKKINRDIAKVTNKEIEPGEAQKAVIYALLATDGSYSSEKRRLIAETTSVVQAAIYRRNSMIVLPTSTANLTKISPKPRLVGILNTSNGGEEIIVMLERDFVEAVKTLSSRGVREELMRKVLGKEKHKDGITGKEESGLLHKTKISIAGTDENSEEGRRKIEEVKRKLKERIEKFLTELKLGEGGTVCLSKAEGCQYVLTVEHEPYARMIIPLLHYITTNAPPEEVGKFLVYAILFDGSVKQNQVTLAVGSPKVKDISKHLPLNVFDKVALYLVLAAKYDIDVKMLYFTKEIAILFFNIDNAVNMFNIVWDDLEPLWRWGRSHGLKHDHVLKKLERMKNRVEKMRGRLNAVKIAGVEFSVNRRKTDSLKITYQSTFAERIDAAVKALIEAGFEEGLHFTVNRPENGNHGYIALKIPAALWKLVELKRMGIRWAEEVISRLYSVAKTYNIQDILDRYLKPALEAETLEPRNIIVEDEEGGIRAVIKNVTIVWENNRPRIVVEYEINNKKVSFSFKWRSTSGVVASVNLNEERAAVLAALTGDDELKKKRGSTKLIAKHLFALAKYKGIGWELLKWYIWVYYRKT